MVAPSAGAVVRVRFPFSDLSDFKLRPAVVLADAGRGDWILCQVTSKPWGDPHAVRLSRASFTIGSLGRDSYARPGKLFTCSREIMAGHDGRLEPGSLVELTDAVIAVLRGRAAPVR